jgi:hypothetical protein
VVVGPSGTETVSVKYPFGIRNHQRVSDLEVVHVPAYLISQSSDIDIEDVRKVDLEAPTKIAPLLQQRYREICGVEMNAPIRVTAATDRKYGAEIVVSLADGRDISSVPLFWGLVESGLRVWTQEQRTTTSGQEIEIYISRIYSVKPEVQTISWNNATVIPFPI